MDHLGIDVVPLVAGDAQGGEKDLRGIGIHPLPRRLADDLPQQVGVAAVIVPGRARRRHQRLGQDVLDRIGYPEELDQIVPVVAVGQFHLVPLQPGAHGQQVFQRDPVLGAVPQIGVLGKVVKHFVPDAPDPPLVDGDADQRRGHALGHRRQIVPPVPVKLDEVAAKLVAGIVPGVATKVLLEHELAVLDDQQAVDIGVGAVANTGRGPVEWLGIEPDLGRTGRLPAVARLRRHSRRGGRTAGPAAGRQQRGTDQQQHNPPSASFHLSLPYQAQWGIDEVVAAGDASTTRLATTSAM